MLTGSEFLSYGAQKVTPSTVGRCLGDETHIPEVVVALVSLAQAERPTSQRNVFWQIIKGLITVI